MESSWRLNRELIGLGGRVIHMFPGMNGTVQFAAELDPPVVISGFACTWLIVYERDSGPVRSWVFGTLEPVGYFRPFLRIGRLATLKFNDSPWPTLPD